LNLGQNKTIEERKKFEKKVEDLLLCFKDLKAKNKSFKVLIENLEAQINEKDNQLAILNGKCELYINKVTELQNEMERLNNLQKEYSLLKSKHEGSVEEHAKLKDQWVQNKQLVFDLNKERNREVEFTKSKVKGMIENIDNILSSYSE
jgi:hypothetical protein